METASFSSSFPKLPQNGIMASKPRNSIRLPPPSCNALAHSKNGLKAAATRRRDMISACKGTNGDNYYSGRLVDESMIVLRLRMKELEMIEREVDDDAGLSSDRRNWMKWEKRYFQQHYCKDVFALLYHLQTFLMNTRPSVALGLVGLVLLSVLISAGMLFSCTLEMAKIVIFDRLPTLVN